MKTRKTIWLVLLGIMFLGAAAPAFAVPDVTPANSVINPISGTLYFVDNDNSPAKVRVYEETSSGWSHISAEDVSLPSGAACYNLAVNADGTKLYISISDGTSSKIRAYTLASATGYPGSYADMSGAYWSSSSSAAGVIVGGDNKLFAVDKGVGRFLVFNTSTNAWIKDVTDQLSGKSNLYSVATTATSPTDTSYKIYISRKIEAGEIYVFTYNNGTITYSKTLTSGLTYPTHLKVVDGKLFVAVNGTNGVDVRVYGVGSENLIGSVKSGITGSYGWTAFDVTLDSEWLIFKKAANAGETSNKLYKIKVVDISGTVTADLMGSSAIQSDGVAVSSDWSHLALTFSPTGALQIYGTGMEKPNTAPSKASNMKTFENNSGSLGNEVAEGAVSEKNRFFGQFTVSDPDAGDLITPKLQYVRTKPYTSNTGLVTGEPVTSGTSVNLPFPATSVLPDGVYQWQIICEDKKGEKSYSDFKTLRVDTKGPVTKNLTPADGAVTGSLNATITAGIDDTETGLSTIIAAEYFIDLPQGQFYALPTGGSGTPMTLLHTAGSRTSETATAIWNTTTLVPGTHTLSVRGQDALGHWGTLETNTVTISNQSPSINYISPNTGVQGSTVNVLIQGGTYFPGVTIKLTKSGETDIVATNVVIDPTYYSSLTCDLPLSGAALGAWTVVVTNPDTQTVSLVDGFTVTPAAPAPTVTSIDPNNAEQGQTVPVINLKGTNFVSGATVIFFPTGAPFAIPYSATNVTVINSETIACSLALPGSAPLGAYTVRVINPDSQSGQLVDGFTVYAPSTGPKVTAITPNTGDQGTNVSVTIDGSAFQSGLTAKLARTAENEIPITVTNVTATQITGTINIPAGATLGQWTVLVTNPDLHTGWLYNGFTVTTGGSTAPTVTSIDPNNGEQGETVPVINLKGTNFVSGATVQFIPVSGTPLSATSVTVINAETIACSLVLPAGTPLGQYTVKVTNPDTQFGQLANGFTVYAPSTGPKVTAITPNSGDQGAIVSVAIIGSAFQANLTAKLAKSGEIDIPIAINNVTATQINGTIVIPSGATLGQWTVLVTNPDLHTGWLYNGFTITSGGGGQISNVTIVRDGDAIGSSVTVNWEVATPGLAADIYAKSGVFSASAADWTLAQSGVTITSYTDSNQVGQGTSKYYKVIPNGQTLTDADLLVDVVGKFDLHVNAGEFSLISLPLLTSSIAISDVIGNQTTAGYDPTTSGTIYSDNNGSWDIAWKDSASGNWLDINWQTSPLTIEADKAYWLFDPANKEITIVGKVGETARTIPIKAGWNFVGSSFPIPTSVANSGLNACTAGYDPTTSGAVYSDNNGSWDIAWKDSTSGNWLDINWQVSTLQLEAGKGYWFYEPSAPFTWNYPKPY